MPLMLLGGINRRDTMEQAMAQGFDFVAMGRALLREPDLVHRLAGASARPAGVCIHCNRCMPTIYSGTRCPVVEARRSDPYRQPRTCSRLAGMTSPTDAKPLRVVAWSTGTVGRHAIAGIDAHPDLELVGVWVSNPDKDGKDAGQLADLGRDLGVAATTDRDALLALAPDAIVHTAMADDRVFECIEDLFGFVEAGVNVVSSGPVLLQWPEKILPDEMLDRLAAAGARTGASLHVNGIDPGFANDVLPLSLTSLSPADRRGAGPGARRLLDVLPARGDARDLRLRQAAGGAADALGAGHPHHGVGQRGPAARRRARASPSTSR